MIVPIVDLPEGVQVQVEGSRAVVAYGAPDAPTVVSVAVADDALILFPSRSYKHADLVKALGLGG